MKKVILFAGLLLFSINLFSQQYNEIRLTDSVSKQSVQINRGEKIIVQTDTGNVKGRIDYINNDTLYLYFIAIPLNKIESIKYKESNRIKTFVKLGGILLLFALISVLLCIILFSIAVGIAFGNGNSLIGTICLYAGILFYIYFFLFTGTSVAVFLMAIWKKIFGKKIWLKNNFKK
jgi:hypothetical protein